MNLQALKFVGRAMAPLQSVLQIDVASMTASTIGPEAYVVRRQDLGPLRQLGDVLIDRGVKHPAKPLAQLLLRQKKVPFVEAPYAYPGRVVRGVRQLLEHAARQDDRNRYIIGIDDALFGKLWQRSDASDPRKEKRALRAGRNGVEGFAPLLDHLTHEPVPPELRDRDYIGTAPEVELVRQLILKVARVDDPVLILGPTGSGKENVARAIHRYSERARLPFVAVNTAAITATLFERELFGHVKGAFTDAKTDRAGFWESAGGGTLLLDEIGDLDLDLQKKILRALEAGEIFRVGSTRPMKVHARVIAATNRDLFAMVQNGQFREDLYYRLRGLMIPTPALAEHPEDVEVLAQHLWRQITKDTKATLPDDVTGRLEGYRWPGNVRELRAVLVNLHAFFSNATPRRGDLELIFALQGQSTATAERPGDHDLTLHRAKCLRHLRRADELIRACQVTLQPVIARKRIDCDTLDTVHDALHYRLHELHLLCLHPLLFHGEATFEAVNHLKAKLEQLHNDLQRGPVAARAEFAKEMAAEFKPTLSAIFKEVERLMART